MHFRGHVRDLPLAGLLAVLHEQRGSHDVRLCDGQADGLLVVREGALVHAELSQQRGLPAFSAACKRDELVYEVCAPEHVRARTIASSHAQLLSLAAQEQVHGAELESEVVSRLIAERARASRSAGGLALGLAVVLAGMLMLLKPHAHAGDHGAPAQAAAAHARHR